MAEPLRPCPREFLTRGDKVGKLKQYDAYVSFCEEDLPFVVRMIRVLEKKYKLRLLIPERDLINGGSKYEITAQAIEDRCRRTLIVLSPEYIGSPQCKFEIRYATTLSPDAAQQKFVPVIIKPCQVPTILKLMVMHDFTRPQFHRWFWMRLYDTIKSEHLKSISHKGAVNAPKRNISEPRSDRPRPCSIT